MARRILTGPGAWAWDPDQLSWQASEVELVSQGELMRLDRLVQRGDDNGSGGCWTTSRRTRRRTTRPWWRSCVLSRGGAGESIPSSRCVRRS